MALSQLERVSSLEKHPNQPSPLAGEGRPKAGERGLLANARRMRRKPTDAERRLWSVLRAKRLAGHKFKRQQPLGRFIVDFVNFEHRLIIEADGSQHADNPQDVLRDDWLKSQGFKVLRFWNSDILNNTDSVAEAIWRELHPTSPPLPNPSPARGEGPDDGDYLV